MASPQKPKEIVMTAADKKAIFEDLFLFDKYIKWENIAKRHHATLSEVRKIYNDFCEESMLKLVETI